jgi:U3 small nucleolar RNA-associated protein 7
VTLYFRFMLFGGRKGHVAVMDCLRTSVGVELQLQEEVNDVQYLQNETLFAVAQNRYTYIYDYKGVEVHCLRDLERPYKLEFLPYHYLLCSVGQTGWLKWHDVSTGDYVTGYQTGHGPCKVMKQNRRNGVLHLGHSNGVVSLWSPSAGKPLVSMFCHKAPVTDVAVDRDGKYMATAGMDGMLKIWDLRKYTCLHTYHPDWPVKSIDVSDTGLISVGTGRTVQVLSGAFTTPSATTYIKHEIRTPNAALSSGAGATASSRALLSNVSVNCVKFRPFEDVCVAGHSHGVTSVIVPGSGEPNYDSFESNPFINPKQRREAEIQSLLHKLSPDMISLGLFD